MSRRGRDSSGLPVYLRCFLLDSFCVLYHVPTEKDARAEQPRMGGNGTAFVVYRDSALGRGSDGSYTVCVMYIATLPLIGERV